ncbi:transposase, IS481 family [Bordetella pertussis CHLA-26]|uniref:Transposase, IS481 family n=1 Tax=Bordetella pertussis CHLA-26 TaxID=1331284 RepID=A0AAI9J267_BORPT|nr:transposase, IS481 family [Bordetella pertussis CHLA-26]
MNTHKHARLTFLRRLEMVQQLIAHQVCVPEAARAYGVTAPTVRKWLGRFLAQGQAGLADASSRPTVSPRAIAPAKALAIVELRRKRLTQARIAQPLGVSASTVSRVLARAGLSHLADLEPAEPVVRYEHQPPAICCTSTSRSWDVSSALATGSRATDAIPLRGPAGTSSSWPSMTTPAWPSPTSTPTSASPAPSSSSRTQWPTTSAWA